MIDLEGFKSNWSSLKDKTIYLAFSGGVDSVVLANLVSQLTKNLTLLHVNFNLRGKESLEDELFVRTFAQENRFKLEVKSIETKKLLDKGNLQAFARKLRYDWFETFLNNSQDVLLIGHHQDDQLETFYQNLVRKSGVFGLSCMLEQDGNKYRPLLNYSKAEIYAYAKQNNLNWREDSSNKSNKYQRNRLRNEVLPFLENQLPDLRASVNILIQCFQYQRKIIENEVDELIIELQKIQKLAIKTWQELSSDHKVCLLKHFNLQASQLVEVEKIVSGQKGKRINSDTVTLVKEDTYLAINPITRNDYLPELIIEEVNHLPSVFSKQEIYLDKAKIKGELRLEPWSIGDRISPIGLKGSQLVSDIITDAKIPNSERSHVLVLKDNEDIHWVVGLKVGRKAVASNTTTEILKLSIQ